ncbi:hypothetical protein D3C78_1485350 [compost metagenome]
MSEMPSWAFFSAWARPRIWPRRFSEMLRPAASSAARLTRRPLDSFSSDLERARSVMPMFRWVLMAETLVLIRSDMSIPP